MSEEKLKVESACLPTGSPLFSVPDAWGGVAGPQRGHPSGVQALTGALLWRADRPCPLNLGRLCLAVAGIRPGARHGKPLVGFRGAGRATAWP